MIASGDITLDSVEHEELQSRGSLNGEREGFPERGGNARLYTPEDAWFLYRFLSDTLPLCGKKNRQVAREQNYFRAPAPTKPTERLA